MDVVVRALRVGAIGVLMMLTAVNSSRASGHGPVFGAATPTLGKGGWSFDQAWMGQVMDGPADTSALLRSMISFGITEKLQISGSLPVPLTGTSGMPSGRMMAMMSGNPDFESLLGWRFQTRPIGEGARFESTAYVGAIVPLDSKRAGIATSPAGLFSLTSGYASRSHYFWAGASHLRHTTRSGDRFGSVTSVTLVYGYRPPAWRKDYPKPDLRFFIEAAGDVTGSSLHNGQTMADTGGRIALAGPTMLLLYKAYAIEGGVMFPVYQRNRPMQPNERFRFGVNFTYFFWPSKGKGH
jgi:hypothetical protein